MTDEPNQQSVSKAPEPIHPDGERYKSLEILIEPFIHLSLNELPDAVRKRVDEDDFLSSFWDGRPDHRRRLAQKYDNEYDPAMAPENEYWFELTCEIGDCKREIDMWELMQHQSISEAVQKEVKLTELNAKMATLQLKYSVPYTAPAQTTATPAPVVAGNEPVPASKRTRKRRTWRDVAMPYVVETYRAGKYKTAHVFYVALVNKAGLENSPFTLHDRELFMTDIGKPLAEKTIENAMPEIKAAARLAQI